MHGELFTTKVVLENRSYFFNVKENRTGDVFLQVVESKSKNGEDFDRRAIVIFSDDMQQFAKGLDESLAFIEKDKRERSKAGVTKRPSFADADRSRKDGLPPAKKVYRKKADGQERGRPRDDSKEARFPPNSAQKEKTSSNAPKRTGKVHIVSKKK
jgi:hypothetical protein